MKKKVMIVSLLVLAVAARGISAVSAQGNGNGPGQSAGTQHCADSDMQCPPQTQVFGADLTNVRS